MIKLYRNVPLHPSPPAAVPPPPPPPPVAGSGSFYIMASVSSAHTRKHFRNTLGACYGSELSESPSDLAAHPDIFYFFLHFPLLHVVQVLTAGLTSTNSSPQRHISGCTLALSGHRQRLGCSTGQGRDQGDLRQPNKAVKDTKQSVKGEFVQQTLQKKCSCVEKQKANTQ